MKFLDSFVIWASANLEHDSDTREYISGRGVSAEVSSRMMLGSVTSDFLVDPSDDPNHDPKGCKDRHSRCDSCRFDAWSHIWEPDSPAKFKLLDSVVMPLTTYSGQIVGIQVRHTKEKVFDTFVLKKRPEAYFFGVGPNLDAIFTQKTVFITEAPFDCMTLQSCGFAPSISICTNSVSLEQSKTILRFCDRVYTCLDSDAAGRSGAKEFYNRFSDKLNISNVIIPETFKVRDGDSHRVVKDFNELQKHFGNDAVKKVIGEQL